MNLFEQINNNTNFIAISKINIIGKCSDILIFN